VSAGSSPTFRAPEQDWCNHLRFGVEQVQGSHVQIRVSRSRVKLSQASGTCPRFPPAFRRAFRDFGAVCRLACVFQLSSGLKWRPG